MAIIGASKGDDVIENAVAGGTAGIISGAEMTVELPWTLVGLFEWSDDGDQCVEPEDLLL
jgi:hypothetical protein